MGWNRPKEGTTEEIRVHRGTGRRFAGPVAVLIAVAGALGWWLWSSGDERCQPSEQGKPPAAIRTVTPVKVARPVEEPAVAAEPSAATGEVVRIGALEYDLAKLRKENPAAYQEVTAKYARVQAELERIRRSPVKGVAEQLLALSTPGEKGEAIPPLPLTDADMETMETEAEKMLATEPKVEEHDTDQSIDIKNRLIELKEEYAAARDKGLSFVDFIRSREVKAKDDAAHLQDAIRLNEETYNDVTVSDKDYEATRKKIDNLLKLEGYKGLPPLTEEQVQSSEEHAERQTEEAK